MSLQTEFLELAFRNPSIPHFGIEIFCLSELRRRMTPAFFKRLQRPRFHLLVLYIAGQGSEEIDFVKITCRPGTVLQVYPGQVLRYLSIDQAEAHLILFKPEFLLPESETLQPFNSHLQLNPRQLVSFQRTFEALQSEYTNSDGSQLSENILRHQLMALLLQLTRLNKANLLESELSNKQQTLLHQFQKALEQGFMQSRTVQDYADELNCSARTLNRATQQLTGSSAKQLIDERVTLEAKRLLAHTPLSIAEIASRLNFSESTNFVKFFRHRTGQLPGAFRISQSQQSQN